MEPESIKLASNKQSGVWSGRGYIIPAQLTAASFSLALVSRMFLSRTQLCKGPRICYICFKRSSSFRYIFSPQILESGGNCFQLQFGEFSSWYLPFPWPPYPPSPMCVSKHQIANHAYFMGTFMMDWLHNFHALFHAIPFELSLQDSQLTKFLAEIFVLNS